MASTTFTGPVTSRNGFIGNTTGVVNGTIQSLSGAGAVNTTTAVTCLTTTGAAQALTLANGTVGQFKTIVHIVDGGSAVLTPTTAIGLQLLRLPMLVIPFSCIIQQLVGLLSAPKA
jgi:molybdopterin-binding protein